MDVRRWVAGLLLVPLLAGCSDYAKSDGKEPPTSVSPAATESETSDNELPPRASNTGATGAEAFLRRWIAVLNKAQTTGDVDVLRQLSANSCVSCKGVIDWVEEVWGNGGHISGGQWRLLSVNAYPHRTDTRIKLGTVVHYAAATVVKANAERERIKELNDLVDFDLAHRDGTWTVRSFQVIKP